MCDNFCEFCFTNWESQDFFTHFLCAFIFVKLYIGFVLSIGNFTELCDNLTLIYNRTRSRLVCSVINKLTNIQQIHSWSQSRESVAFRWTGISVTKCKKSITEVIQLKLTEKLPLLGSSNHLFSSSARC